MAGSGIRIISQMTRETEEAVRSADVVLYGLAEPATPQWIRSLNRRTVSLSKHYAAGRRRTDTYDAMVKEILSYVEGGDDVCALFYGHPAVYVTPSHAAIRAVRELGRPAKMLPAISAEACLYADLGLDPGLAGWQSYDATAFVAFTPQIDTQASLVLWQLDGFGYDDYQPDRTESKVAALVSALLNYYPSSHRVAAYECSPYPDQEPRVDWYEIRELAQVPDLLTLYIPPVQDRTVSLEALSGLGLT